MAKATEAGLSCGLAVEEVQGEGAEGSWNALLLVQMLVNHLVDSLGKFCSQQLHLGAGGS